jgi:membrane protein DedA with SNARE-associated domain
MSGLLHQLADWAVIVVERLGYFGVFFLVALENLIPPIPSELILPLAGFSVGQGSLSFIGVVAAASLGSIVGALFLYGLGYWFGEARLRAFVRRFAWLPFVDEQDIDKAEHWFNKYGQIAVLTGRLIPVVRSVVSIPAGYSRMPLGPFILYTLIGSTTWNVALVTAGWLLGDRWEEVRGYMQYFEYAVILAIGLAILLFIYRRWTARRAGGNGARPTTGD